MAVVSFNIEELNLMHSSIHMADAPKPDENEDSEVLKFIDQHSTCA